MNRLQNRVEYTFSFPVKLTGEERAEVEERVKVLSPEGLKINCKFQLDDYNAKTVKNDIENIIYGKNPSFGFRDGISVSCTQSDERVVTAKITADKVAAEMLESAGVLEALAGHFQTVTTTHVSLEVLPYEKSLDAEKLLDKIQKRQELAVEIQLMRPKRFFEVSDKYLLIGREINSPPRYISDVIVPSKNCTICGRASNLKSFPTKNPDLIVCKMDIHDTTDGISAVIFARNQAYQKFLLISEGDELIVSGSVDRNSYSGRREIKAYNISKCKIDFSPPKAEHKDAGEQYITVTPMPYFEQSQISLFDDTACTAEFLLANDIIVFDVETTGLEPKRDKIIEIGAVRVHKGKITETFSTFIDPEIPLPQSTKDITKITDAMLVGQPVFGAVAGDFYKFSRNAILVAHNIDFDYGFLDNSSAQYGYIFDNAKYDTMVLARKLFISSGYRGPRASNYKLSSVADALGIPYDTLHRALDDAVLAAKVMIKIFKLHPNLL